jgi:nucleolar complex protein 3
MIKERHYAVHPNVLSALWYVKVKAGKDNAYIKKPARHWDKDRDWKKKAQRGKGNMKGKGEGSEWSEKKKEWRTKKMRKDMRDKKEIEKEMDEAEAEVDEEEAGRNVSLPLWSSVPHPACCIPWLTL